MTSAQAQACDINRALYKSGQWTVVVTDEDAQSYVIYITADEVEDNVLLKAIYDELLLTEKKTAPVITLPTVRDLSGLKPTPTVV